MSIHADFCRLRQFFRHSIQIHFELIILQRLGQASIVRALTKMYLNALKMSLKEASAENIFA